MHCVVFVNMCDIDTDLVSTALLILLSKLPKKINRTKKGGIKAEKDHLSPFCAQIKYIKLGQKIVVPDNWVRFNILELPSPSLFL